MTGNALVTVTFILLCHDSAERVVSLVRQLLEEDPDCRVIVHLDKKSPKDTFRKLVSALDDEPRCHLMRNRVRCGWGQWGLVEAPLRALRHALSQEVVSDYFYLMSEYCRPVRQLSELREFLTAHQRADFIECETSDWIKGGIREDRYLYRHYLDKRKHPKLHRWMYRMQKKLGLKRKPPPQNFDVRFGSQWWCLSLSTVRKILEEFLSNSEFSYFRVAWIPDEIFFQSAVYKLSEKSCRRKSLTYVRFDEQGKAMVLKDCHENYFDCFFARKFYCFNG